ncbi:hypothetical protein AWZ03_010825 [Drosophila navojoa]|uniref:Uncharacterized protein n=1 Tax=Drosophila navojoa TaxID=7232 RepID=A0A484B1K5_DRONA|nr:hypothetical protein AWZ03_010825 [Drosophila navojoa]
MASLGDSESFLQTVIAAAAATAAQIAQLTTMPVDQHSSQPDTSVLFDEFDQEMMDLNDLQELKELQEHLNCGSSCPIKLRSRNYTDIAGRRPIHTPKAKAKTSKIPRSSKSPRARRIAKKPKSPKKLTRGLKIGHRGGTPKKATPPSLRKRKQTATKNTQPVTQSVTQPVTQPVSQRRPLYTRTSPKVATKRKSDDSGYDGPSSSKRRRYEKTPVKGRKTKGDSSLSGENQRESPQIIDTNRADGLSVPELASPEPESLSQIRLVSQSVEQYGLPLDEAESTPDIQDLSQTLTMSEIQDDDDFNEVTLTYKKGQKSSLYDLQSDGRSDREDDDDDDDDGDGDEDDESEEQEPDNGHLPNNEQFRGRQRPKPQNMPKNTRKSGCTMM